MTFSFYHSLCTVPADMRQVASTFQFNWWQTLNWIEVPYAAIGLIWNSMMSMAGGWFFLMIAEAFVLGDHDFRLPGIGSYMSVAIEQGDKKAMLAAIVTMILLIVALDNLIWKPLVAWAQKFKLEESESETPVRSRVLQFLRRSRFFSRGAMKIRNRLFYARPSKRT